MSRALIALSVVATLLAPTPAGAQLRTERPPPFDVARACVDHGLSPPPLCGAAAAPLAYADVGGPENTPARLSARGTQTRRCTYGSCIGHAVSSTATTGIGLVIPAGSHIEAEAVVEVVEGAGIGGGYVCFVLGGTEVCRWGSSGETFVLSASADAPADATLVADPRVEVRAPFGCLSPGVSCIPACPPDCPADAGSVTVLVRLFAYTLS